MRGLYLERNKESERRGTDGFYSFLQISFPFTGTHFVAPARVEVFPASTTADDAARFWASMLKLSLVDSFPAMCEDGNDAKKGIELVKAFTHKYSLANMLHLNDSHRQQHKFARVHYTPICRFATRL